MAGKLVFACAAATTLAFAPSPATRSSLTQRSAVDYFGLGAGEKTAANDAAFMSYLQQEAQAAQALTNETGTIEMPTLSYPSAVSGFQVVTPYAGDQGAGFLESPITNSMMTKMILGNLAAYREGLTSKARGLEIGLAHGYLFFGPFFKMGPMRASAVADYAGLMSTMAFVLMLTMALTAYSYIDEDNETIFDKEFNGGFLAGGWGSAVFAFLCVHAANWTPIVNTPTFQP